VLVELLEEFPRLIRAKLYLKIEDNRLHSNGEVKHRELRGIFQQSGLGLIKMTAGSDALGFCEESFLLQLKRDLLVGGQDRAYSFRNARRCCTTFTKVRAWSVEANFHRRFAVVALNIHELRHRSKTMSVFSRLVKNICDLN
jgi:hypothetical protein